MAGRRATKLVRSRTRTHTQASASARTHPSERIHREAPGPSELPLPPRAVRFWASTSGGWRSHRRACCDQSAGSRVDRLGDRRFSRAASPRPGPSELPLPGSAHCLRSHRPWNAAGDGIRTEVPMPSRVDGAPRSRRASPDVSGRGAPPRRPAVAPALPPRRRQQNPHRAPALGLSHAVAGCAVNSNDDGFGCAAVPNAFRTQLFQRCALALQWQRGVAGKRIRQRCRAVTSGLIESHQPWNAAGDGIRTEVPMPSQVDGAPRSRRQRTRRAPTKACGRAGPASPPTTESEVPM